MADHPGWTRITREHGRYPPLGPGDGLVHVSSHTLIVGWETIFEVLGTVTSAGPPLLTLPRNQTDSAPSSPSWRAWTIHQKYRVWGCFQAEPQPGDGRTMSLEAQRQKSATLFLQLLNYLCHRTSDLEACWQTYIPGCLMPRHFMV